MASIKGAVVIGADSGTGMSLKDLQELIDQARAEGASDNSSVTVDTGIGRNATDFAIEVVTFLENVVKS